MASQDIKNTDEQLSPAPDFRLADEVFILQNPNLESCHGDALKRLLEAIEKDKLGPLYLNLHLEYLPSIPWDDTKYQEYKKDNDAKVAEIEKSIKEAEEAGGETDISEGWTKLGEYYARIGDKKTAIKTLRKAYDVSPGVGAKVDILLTIIRIAMFFDDKALTQRELENTKVLIDQGGDWERRNRFKTYNGLYLLSIRNFDEAADLLLDSLSTFTSTELCTYEQVVEYAVIAASLSLDRVNLKTRVVDSPELLSLLPTTPSLEPLATVVNALYTCDYSTFFYALAEIEEQHLRKSRYLAPHSKFYIREMRRKAYDQLLQSYRTLSLKSMAQAFGVSVEFLDADLSSYIPAKKLNCMIDRVNGIIHTNRPDSKNQQYQSLVKQGDALLTKLQKYGTAVRMSGAERVA